MNLMTKSDPPMPIDIILHQRSNTLEVAFDNGETFKLPAEFLRVYTPSAEAFADALGERILQTGKEDVAIHEIKPVGNYGIAPVFSDGHDTGIYTWERLYELGSEYEQLWANYLQQLAINGITRKSSL